MPRPGPDFYDERAVFETYMRSRQRPDNPNDTLEGPVVRELVGELRGRRILDLGCGDAAFGRAALAAGAGAYHGIEGSANMVAAARATLAGSTGTVERATIEGWASPPAAYNLVISRLALHYVADLPAVCARVQATLRDSGQFVFSVEHPVITSCARGRGAGPRQDWLVDDYFATGQRVTPWLGGEVVKYHRTVEDHFAALTGAGLAVEALREAAPQPARFADPAEYERRRRIPLFLILAARKLPGSR